LALPLGYGWAGAAGGRPTRRITDAATTGGCRTTRTDPSAYPGYGWSWIADLFWLAILAALAWAIYLWVT
jgi:hypothetical protein